MKKTLIALSLAILACVSAAAEILETDHYSIEYPEGFQGMEEASRGFEAIRSSFDELFRFAGGGSLGKVLVLADKAAYDEYLAGIIGTPRNQYLFLKYADPEASRLVLYPAQGKSGYAAFSGPDLNRQLLLQYLYRRINEPPLWIREGFQAYFENLVYDPSSGTLSTGGYSPWLETAKNLASDGSRYLSPEDVLSALAAQYESAAFYPQAWSLVKFFLSTERGDYLRFLHESFVLLDSAGGEGRNLLSQAENTDLVLERFARFTGPSGAERDFTLWLERQKTYAQMVQEGMDAYSAGSWAQARASFAAAFAVHPEDPMPLYYRGLTEYAAKEYAEADRWYKKALEAGAEPSTVNWALGLSAMAEGRNAEARAYLTTAKTANPARYGERADKLLKSLPK